MKTKTSPSAHRLLTARVLVGTALTSLPVLGVVTAGRSQTAGEAKPNLVLKPAPSPVGGPIKPAPVLNSSPTVITVNAGANLLPISPLVYGAAYATTAQIADLNLPINRYGGDNTSRYNWQLNADNKGSDYYFESIGDTSAVPGYRGDNFISSTRAGNPYSEVMLTIPMLDYVANLGANRSILSSYSVAKYGAQTSTDYWDSDAGNGVLASNYENITWNNPLDADVPSSPAFQQGWVQHIVANWNTTAEGGLNYYILDNEPSLWHATHRDVHPNGAGMDEVVSRIENFSTMIKSVDPSALVVAPEEWGWSGYLYSGMDQQYGNTYGWGGYLPDQTAHNGWLYLPYVLNQLQAKQTATGKRLLDVFSVHFYPQGGEYWNGDDSTTDALRNVSTRSLWDPNYVDQSWINSVIQLIPRLQGWVNSYLPGTGTAITEYSWGDDGYMNGATAQADILGIFGRQGLTIGTRWTCPSTGNPTYEAFKIYRNYDGNNGAFGDVSVSDSAPAPDNISSFAALRSSDGALTIIVDNKNLSGGNAAVTINLSNFSAGASALAYQFSAASPTIAQIASVPVGSSSLSVSVPQQSVTMYVVPRAAALGVVSIPVTLSSYLGTTSKVPLSVQVRNVGAITPLDYFTGYLSGGVLSFKTARVGTYDIAIQGPTFLRKVIHSVAITATGAAVGGVTLTNGDSNGDNMVSLADYTAVLASMGATSSSSNWLAGADLNGDGVVNSADLAIVTANMRKNGDQ